MPFFVLYMHIVCFIEHIGVPWCRKSSLNQSKDLISVKYNIFYFAKHSRTAMSFIIIFHHIRCMTERWVNVLINKTRLIRLLRKSRQLYGFEIKGNHHKITLVSIRLSITAFSPTIMKIKNYKLSKIYDVFWSIYTYLQTDR